MLRLLVAKHTHSVGPELIAREVSSIARECAKCLGMLTGLKSWSEVGTKSNPDLDEGSLMLSSSVQNAE